VSRVQKCSPLFECASGEFKVIPLVVVTDWICSLTSAK